MNSPGTPSSSPNAAAPSVELAHLDHLWFQVAGTLCNLTCGHCFISCSPTNDSFGHLSLENVRSVLPEAERLGVREYYFTGGEPFLNREMVPIIEETLRFGPVTVLTNATVLRPERSPGPCSTGAGSLNIRITLPAWASTNTR